MTEILLVTGYYRSGTSALASSINKMGFEFKNTAHVDKFNPNGYYEIPDFIQFDDAIFNDLALSWSDLRPLPNRWWTHRTVHQKQQQLQKLISDNFSSSQWGIKHPYLCRLMPMYREVLSKNPDNNVKNVHITRNPWISGASQMKKNGLSRTHSLLLWLVYIIDVERNTRDMKRSWIMYDDLIKDATKQFEKIESDIDVVFSDKNLGAGMIQEELNHNSVLPLVGTPRVLITLIDDVWKAIITQNYNPDMWDDFYIGCMDIVNLISEAGKSLMPVVPGVGTKKPGDIATRAEGQLKDANRN